MQNYYYIHDAYVTYLYIYKLQQNVHKLYIFVSTTVWFLWLLKLYA